MTTTTPRTTVQSLRGGFVISASDACAWATTLRGPEPDAPPLLPDEYHSLTILVTISAAIRRVGGVGCGFHGTFAGDKYVACSHRQRKVFDVALYEENLVSGVVPPSYEFEPNEATARVEKLLDDSGACCYCNFTVWVLTSLQVLSTASSGRGVARSHRISETC
ncbi:hypothetical protein PLICRDRAFT_46874 [Plicaturopsis crispa FD-325 SS-3]|uniref:Uncharacterized protein n=1 Tax=Plicaturopsis crispa FD-325 SS-3 TaxID=944288 RepID=A0A0C9T387_PLICR|nr:hypothetical protein PLICRDRAFT_46874 [Plicaturopsis crispa FD-325 SS-3]